MGKIGFKRSDRRYRSDDGQEWDSRFEWQVWDGLRSAGYDVRRATEDDSIGYHTQVKQGRCLECGSVSVLQDRIYTPDLYVAGLKGKRASSGSSYYVECKGYFPADKRNLFRSVANQATGIDLRIVFPKEIRLKGTTKTNVEYIQAFCKTIKVGIWNKETGDILWL